MLVQESAVSKTDSGENEHGAGMDVSDLRRSKTDRTLMRQSLAVDPIVQFERWFR